MPIDVSRALGAALPEGRSTWDADDVMLYHLGVGAGVPPTDAKELEYTYEQKLKVLPSFGVIPVFATLTSLVSVPGLEFNPLMLLHGEQDIRLHRPIPVSGSATHRGKVSAIYDKGKAALIVVDVESVDGDGQPLFTNRFSAFVRGEGGFGGESGPKAGNEAPDREPDAVAESATLPQQALLYRLSGDRNPLHADPSFSKMAGYEQPILHGLCTFGVVCKAVVDTMLDGDTSKVRGYAARFAGVVYPGQTIVTSMWRDGGTILVRAATQDGTTVLTNAAVTVG